MKKLLVLSLMMGAFALNAQEVGKPTKKGTEKACCTTKKACCKEKVKKACCKTEKKAESKK